MAGVVVGLAIGLYIRLPARWDRFVVARAVTSVSNDLWAVCVPPRRAAGLTCLSVFAIWCNALNIFLLVRSLGVPVGLLDTMVLAPLVILVLVLPISIGGWGLREGAMVGLLGIIGIAPAISLSVSILTGLLSTAVSLPGALVWLQWWYRADAPQNADAHGHYAGVRNAES
jgi:glycosyltransferase 2 family protein